MHAATTWIRPGNHPGRMMPGRRRADTVTVNDQAQDGAMRNTQRSTGTQASSGGGGLQVRSGPLVSGAALVGVGGLIALVGVAIGGFHLLSAVRQWVSEMEMPPSELAKQKLAQAKAAAAAAGAAGAGAWQNAPADSRAPVS
jgi:hypothetical protein